ncbi:sigma-70 family RNA polymerase sigma factor [Priestia endophytica]|uniref:sigma-70 family RNA polymerase sigma factor n=1 Tax=Priestia endophytica TaxID=135735 RepID=UPI002281141B|nr:sigma-70 family RNA polymerase sigma factor [Priestia endophytica]MCY8233687.1 sigma-70 family RNA polymerase sigma factor [Priestia endophytica]
MKKIIEVNRDQIHLITKTERLERVYKKGTRYYIIALEEAWDRYLDLSELEGEDAFRVMYNNPSMYFLVGKKIDKFTKAWSKKGLTREDFTSIFWATAWKVTEEHTFRDDYFLYEKIPKALEGAGIDYVRSCLNTDKRKASHDTVSYKDSTSYRFEGDVETNILIEQYCNDIERALLHTYLESPTISYAELGRLHGINHHQKVKRILENSLNKLRTAMLE